MLLLFVRPSAGLHYFLGREEGWGIHHHPPFENTLEVLRICTYHFLRILLHCNFIPPLNNFLNEPASQTSCMILFDKYPDLDVTATELSRQKYFSLCNVQELCGIEDTHRVSHLMKWFLLSTWEWTAIYSPEEFLGLYTTCTCLVWECRYVLQLVSGRPRVLTCGYSCILCVSIIVWSWQLLWKQNS